MSFIDKLIYTLLSLVIITFIGTITGSWRFILYPYLIVIGIAILFGILKNVKQNPRKMWIPVSVVIVYIILYAWLDIMTIDTPTGGSKYIFGLTPSMALYILGIWPLANLICLLYAWTFSKEETLNN
ncbi:hypothetical protein AMS59_11985 [Lysinibacillus sp. FJAT-14745]|uniref:hypothetical protein n=1 Tax=Lysinibacillus sp. FJAT-14745 TaxID=1704289 RepID=UPI0006AB9EC2|nr:hypothetical protein [Lysinibacillus sp. FJAT-14745]KOP78554.1 hypothetical protein AMS59_11985 [Lysinibacillus sp. FJAT-14745]